MSLKLESALIYSSSQRQCHLLLMMFLPQAMLTLDIACQLNNVDKHLTMQELDEINTKILNDHQLSISCTDKGIYYIVGNELNRRLCILRTLRRALHLSPDFILYHFSPALRHSLQQQNVATPLYDEVNLRSLTTYCSQSLQRTFTPRDHQLLKLMLQYELACQPLPDFSAIQQRWLKEKAEYSAASHIVQCWRKYHDAFPKDRTINMLTWLFSQLYIPQSKYITCNHEQVLLTQVTLLIQRVEILSGTCFQSTDALRAQLYCHLAQALERCCFGAGIDLPSTSEISQLYPRLLTITRMALEELEAYYQLYFSPEEICLVAIILGAWMMQDNVLQEKQILLLTNNNSVLEQQIEQQIRELTLLPLNIKYQNVHTFQHKGAPEGTILVIMPYTAPLPLYSPPLIHAEYPLPVHQQKRICALLES
ncbi:stationary phase inducible protein CsiE [Enterobacteriaceae bacterium LUAb1]